MSSGALGSYTNWAWHRDAPAPDRLRAAVHVSLASRKMHTRSPNPSRGARVPGRGLALGVGRWLRGVSRCRDRSRQRRGNCCIMSPEYTPNTVPPEYTMGGTAMTVPEICCPLKDNELRQTRPCAVDLGGPRRTTFAVRPAIASNIGPVAGALASVAPGSLSSVFCSLGSPCPHLPVSTISPAVSSNFVLAFAPATCGSAGTTQRHWDCGRVNTSS